jgi:hypothetical protein
LLVLFDRRESPVNTILKMAAPPNVANADAQAFLNGVEDIEGPPSVRTARSSKRLEVARELQAVNGITETELGEHEGFDARCVLNAGGTAVEDAIADVPGVPPWFGQAMAAALQPVQAQLNNIEARVNNVEVKVNKLEARVFNNEARLINSVANEPEDPLVALTNEAGVAFVDFPATFLLLMSLNGDQMTAILNHYGLATWGCNKMKLCRIKKFIGMRIA